MTVTACYMDDNWELKTDTLCCVGLAERDYVENLAIALEVVYRGKNKCNRPQ